MNIFTRLFGKNNSQNQEIGTPETTIPSPTYEEVMAQLTKYKRSCYTFETAETPSAFNRNSKMGGYPYLRDERDWPVCPNCKKNMQLFVQLNLSELPENKEEGLIQLFYCTSEEPFCEVDLEGYFPFSKSTEARKIKAFAPSATILPNNENLFPERQIISWERKDDYPHFEEYHELGIELEIDDDIYDLMETNEVGIPIEQDKLFGWPYWVQSTEYPVDRNSGKQMELLFQIASEDNLPYMFGDMGIGHLTQSPDNKEELGFGWACS